MWPEVSTKCAFNIIVTSVCNVVHLTIIQILPRTPEKIKGCLLSLFRLLLMLLIVDIFVLSLKTRFFFFLYLNRSC